jgi:hypothetical protein
MQGHPNRLNNRSGRLTTFIQGVTCATRVNERTNHPR